MNVWVGFVPLWLFVFAVDFGCYCLRCVLFVLFVVVLLIGWFGYL